MLVKRTREIAVGAEAEQDISGDQAGNEGAMRFVVGIREAHTVTNEIHASDHGIVLIQEGKPGLHAGIDNGHNNS